KKLLQDAGTYKDADWQAKGDSFIDACHATSSIRGDKEPWITHLLGGKGTTACIHVTDAARKEARIHKDLEDAKATGRAGKRSAPAQPISGDVAFAAGPSTSTSGPRHDRTASGADEPASKRFKQGSFQVFTGRDQPFTTAETEEIQAQVLRATVSAGLPFRMWENPEVVRLVRMFRTAGPDVLPSRKVVGGRLLNEAAEKVEGTVKAALEMKEVGLITDGWKSRKKADWNGLCANVNYKVFFTVFVGEFLQVYRRINSYPGNTDTPEQRKEKERHISKLMFEYLSSTGNFQGWAAARDDFGIYGKES
ncbi:hypothetical protein DFH08DRAFT_326791, partial [Mycena albidolilacea]